MIDCRFEQTEHLEFRMGTNCWISQGGNDCQVLGWQCGIVGKLWMLGMRRNKKHGIVWSGWIMKNGERNEK